MPGLTKRLLLGRPVRSDRLGHTLLPKWLALPIFASDALSSVAYATQEILRVLAVGGLALLYLTPWVALAVVVLLAVVVVSYQQVVHAYPDGGGSYEVATRNLGPVAGLVAAGALMVDYTLTVAVSVASGIDNVISAAPSLNPYRVPIAMVTVLVLASVNLRGVKESGKAFALPTYAFIIGIVGVVGVGALRFMTGHPPVAESANFAIAPHSGGLAGLALVFVALRAFSSGCTALTGIEAVSNGVPAFRRPASRNASITLGLIGLIAIVMFGGITLLAIGARVHYADNTCDLVGFAGNCAATPQRTVIAQLAAAVFGAGSIPFYFIQAATALILVLAANTAFNGFPQLGALLAQRRYLPRQLHTRGDRLAFSNGILALALAAAGLLLAYKASVDALIHLYVLGVFTAFTLSQLGMVRHWQRTLTNERDPLARRRTRRSQTINAVGGALTAVVLVIVLITKFAEGAYLVVIAVPVFVLLMSAIRRHYDRVGQELQPQRTDMILPARVHALVLVGRLHRPAVRALTYARATRPDTITAITVNIDDEDTRRLQQDWSQWQISVPLTLIDSPYREITRPVLHHIRDLRTAAPRDIVAVYIPEYVVGRWWEQLLHNQSALRLKLRLLFEPGVMVISVPWQLASADIRSERLGRAGREQAARSPLRRGVVLEADRHPADV
ncbi:APC family permease [Dactylosporangium vinaceum]|uniref:APC family permease n=1 Tax=Dactylosporangium vinaceum TaxID=53362 RepID=A0ABV5M996_9ACTN|nr:APC family permease [Dactylosporangium vinaceum]UAC01754.1 APC family permease [Dactylosporangium vinaceum]